MLERMKRADFGGEWTARKLNAVQSYLRAYTTLMREKFSLIYVDAFAGTGGFWQRSDLLTGEEEQFVAGSAVQALATEPRFNQYLLIEKSRARLAALQEHVSHVACGRNNVRFELGDANVVIQRFCRTQSWRGHRGVIFLDPFGMQVSWETLQAIAETKALDVWYLVPTGLGLARLMPRRLERIQRGWPEALTRMLGTEDWKERFYATGPQGDLFSGASLQRPEGNISALETYVIERLNVAFQGGTLRQGLTLGEGNKSFFLLTFSCANPSRRAREISHRLARHIISRG